MMELVTPVVVGGGGAYLTLRYGARLLRRWLILRSRVNLTRAAAQLPAGVRVQGRDAAGAWSATRTARRPR